MSSVPVQTGPDGAPVYVPPDPTANLLRTALAQAENPHDMRLNPALGLHEVAETIRIAIECIEGIQTPGKATIPRDVAARFAGSVQGLFTSDSHWSLYDLDGAREFCEAIQFAPEKSALEVEK